MNRTTNVHLMGGSERSDRAPDADIAAIRQALALVPDVRLVASPQEADIVHGVREYPLLAGDRRRLEGKRIICHFSRDIVRTFEQPCMMRAREIVGLWVAFSRPAEREARGLRLPVAWIPPTVDPDLFMAGEAAGETAAALRRRHGIPEKAYVISSFMRDSEGGGPLGPRPQEGTEMFVEIVAGLHAKGHPVHVLLAGPRCHRFRCELRARGVPFSFIGREMAEDDLGVNVLDAALTRELCHASDLHLVTSRWEGSPRAVLDAAACGIRVASTAVGLADDLLAPPCLFRDVAGGVALVHQDIVSGLLLPTVAGNLERVKANHTPSAAAARYAALYADAGKLAPYAGRAPAVARPAARGGTTGGSALGRLKARWLAHRRARSPGAGLRIGIWHEFHKPPYGGGNQFMIALKRDMERLGASVRCNSTSPAIDVHICNSAWFDAGLLERAGRGGRLRMIHRIDGPVGVYRGGNMAEDDRIYDLNRRCASATVMQSAWCLKKTLELGYEPHRAIIVHNAVDGRVFFPRPRPRTGPRGKLRLIASSWSDNPRKGGPFYKRLEQILDGDRYEFTFVGRTQEQFSRSRHIPALPSRDLAALLRSSDVYVTASRHEPCSNALLEALACGLPALYLDDGSHGELVGQGGLPFSDEDGFLGALERITASYEAFRACVWVESMDDIARRYIELAFALLDDDPRHAA